jgi:8-oxo-dGTP pyrophosphatase MutT (NUDIX family)
MRKVNSVSAFVLNDSNHVLVSERRSKTGYGKLYFPGGKINVFKEDGQKIFESPVKAIYRETLEEAGIRLYNINYAFHTIRKLDSGYGWVNCFYTARSKDTPYEIAPEEQINWQWVELDFFDNPKESFFLPLNDLIIKFQENGTTLKEVVLNSLNENKEHIGEIITLF